jgi:hypothetical protein
MSIHWYVMAAYKDYLTTMGLFVLYGTTFKQRKTAGGLRAWIFASRDYSSCQSGTTTIIRMVLRKIVGIC